MATELFRDPESLTRVTLSEVIVQVPVVRAEADRARVSRNAELSAVQFCLRSQEAQNMSAGEDPLEVPVGDHRQLVDILAAHQFKGLDGRSIRGNGAQLTQSAHHALHAGLRPTFASDSF
jgi:hypothetical protein